VDNCNNLQIYTDIEYRMHSVSVLGQCTSTWVNDLTRLVVKRVQSQTVG